MNDKSWGRGIVVGSTQPNGAATAKDRDPQTLIGIYTGDAPISEPIKQAINREDLAEWLFYNDGCDDWGVANDDEKYEYYEKADAFLEWAPFRSVRMVQAEALLVIKDTLEKLHETAENVYDASVTTIWDTAPQGVKDLYVAIDDPEGAFEALDTIIGALHE
jgi:hypothetical protein